MAAKDKEEKKKPVIKVEEIDDAASEDSEESVTSENEEEKTENKTPEDDIKETSKKDTSPPAVSSFSQLDSAPPAPSEEKSTTDTENSKTLKTEAEVKADTGEESESESDGKDTQEKDINKEQVTSDEVKEWLKDVRPDTTKENEKGKGPGAKLVIFIILILFVVGVVVGGILYFQSGVTEPVGETLTPTDTPQETPTPSPVSEEEEVDLSGITISVLNGSGIAGEAGKVKELLSAGDFSADNVNTGNADSYDYEDLSVSMKEDTPDEVYSTIENLVSGEYEVSLDDESLAASSEYDVMIIVGQ